MSAHVLRFRFHIGQHDVLPTFDNALGQHVFQHIQTAAFQQFRIALDLGLQPLLRRYGHHAVFCQAQNACRLNTLLFNLFFDLLRGAERIPQRIDFVEHNKA